MTFQAIQIDSLEQFETQLTHWAGSFAYAAQLHSNIAANYTYPDQTNYETLVACSAKQVYKHQAKHAFEFLKQTQSEANDWLFGHLTYDLKNGLEKLHSKHSDKIGFAELCFFIPHHIFKKQHGQWYYRGAEHAEQVVAQVLAFKPAERQSNRVLLKPQISKEEYTKRVDTLLQHIKRGDIYEVNFCQEFASANAKINPTSVFQKLMQLSPTPFAGFYRNEKSYLLCASPERFIKKQESTLTSQPIKGTAKRGKTALEDEAIKNELINNPKEQSENVMIVDLVRNDLSHFAAKGSVVVNELFGCYSFPQVHQLISTISAKLKPSINGIDALMKAFPMGSMTGAPKIRAMELIEESEQFKRGLFSGSIGYITPQGDFDFNVVIRSILYNESTGYLSCPVGGAITYKCNAEDEYLESLLKAQAIINLLKNS